MSLIIQPGCDMPLFNQRGMCYPLYQPFQINVVKCPTKLIKIPQRILTNLVQRFNYTYKLIFACGFMYNYISFYSTRHVKMNFADSCGIQNRRWPAPGKLHELQYGAATCRCAQKWQVILFGDTKAVIRWQHTAEIASQVVLLACYHIVNCSHLTFDSESITFSEVTLKGKASQSGPAFSLKFVDW